MKAEIVTKKDIARILVRFLGVYFAYLALGKIETIPYVIYLYSQLGTELEFYEKIDLATIAPQAIRCLFYVAISFYCIRRGKWLIEFISRSESLESKQDDEMEDECETVKKID